MIKSTMNGILRSLVPIFIATIGPGSQVLFAIEVPFWAEQYSLNRRFIEVTVDTHKVPGDFFLNKVKIEVTFFGDRQLKSEFPFGNGRVLAPNHTYVQYFEIPLPRITALKAGRLYWDANSGDNFDVQTSVEASEFSISKRGAELFGIVPPVAESYYGAIAYSTATDDWGTARNYSNQVAADGAAVQQCGASSCSVVVRIENSCGALAITD